MKLILPKFNLQRWLFFLVILGILGGTLVLQIPYSPPIVGLNADSGLFAYYGQQLLQGRVLYRDLWDEKPPGVYYINAAAIALFGSNLWAIWWLNVISIAAAAGLLFLTLSRLAGQTPAALACFLFLLLLMYPDFYQGGNLTEVYALIPQILALWILTVYLSAPKTAWMFALGLATAAAFVFKQTYIAMGVVALLIGLLNDLRMRSFKTALKSLAGYSLGFALPLIVISLLFASQGALAEMIFAIFTYNYFYASQGFSTFTFKQTLAVFKDFLPLAPIFIFGAAGLVVFLSRNWRRLLFHRREAGQGESKMDSETHRAWVFAGVFAAFPLEILLVSISGKNFGHYFLTPLPVMTAGCAYLFMEIGNTARSLFKNRAWLAGLLILLTVAFFSRDLFVLVQNEYPHRKFLGKFIQYGFGQALPADNLNQFILQKTQPSDPVLVWATHPSINFLTGRRSPTRYAFILPLLLATPDTANNYHEFMQELADDPPALILVQPQSSADIPYFGADEANLCPDCPAVVRAGLLDFKQYVAAHYKLTREIYDWEIYRRAN